MTRIGKFIRDTRAASAVEYGLIVALIALAIVAAITLLGAQLSALFNRIVQTLQGV